MSELSTSQHQPLTDRFGRVIRDLRLSVTARCNFRCTYCTPELTSHEPEGTLSVIDVGHVLEAASLLGLSSVRFTGGEPLLRRELAQMIEIAHNTPNIKDIALTTNGTLLRARGHELVKAGLQRINISIDALEPRRFRQISGGDLRIVLDAIEFALELGLHPVKLNAVVMRNVNEIELVPLAALSIDRPLHVRFIEYMHLNNSNPGLYTQTFLSGQAVRAQIENEFGPLEAVETAPSSPARVYRIANAQGTLGFINPISEPFCGACSRMRLTADKKLRPCLLSDRELDARDALANPKPVVALIDLLLEAAHRKERMGDVLPKIRERTMIGIGG